MTRQVKPVKRYSISFKQQVVREIETEGLSLSAAARRYGITGNNTLQRWLQQLGKQHLLNQIVRVETKTEKDRLRELEAELKKYKLAYAEAVLRRDVLESVVALADQHYATDLKKTFGDPPSRPVTKTKVTP